MPVSETRQHAPKLGQKQNACSLVHYLVTLVNTGPPCSTENSIQSLGTAPDERDYENGNVYVGVPGSLCCTAETGNSVNQLHNNK